MTAPALQVGKLVRMLGSDRDGEVIAAARALDRTLRGAGLDFHDLALVAERQLSTSSMSTSTSTSSCRPWWQSLAAECLRHGGYILKRAELDFLSSMSKWPTPPSDKQLSWLAAIAAALDVERRAA